MWSKNIGQWEEQRLAQSVQEAAFGIVHQEVFGKPENRKVAGYLCPILPY